MFHSTATPPRTIEEWTYLLTYYTHRSSAPPGVLFGVFRHCIWPLKAPGCTSEEGRKASRESRQPSDASTPLCSSICRWSCQVSSHTHQKLL